MDRNISQEIPASLMRAQAEAAKKVSMHRIHLLYDQVKTSCQKVNGEPAEGPNVLFWGL